MALTDKLTAIANEIRIYTGKTEKMSLEEMASNIEAVYDEGFENGELQFDGVSWDAIQDSGNRTDYQYGFNRWSGAEYITPKYKVIPTGNCTFLFGYCSSLKKIESKYFDLSGANYTSGSNTSATYRTFVNCLELEEIQDIGLQAGYYERTFQNCEKLKTIAVLRVAKDTKFNLAFGGCKELVDILEIEGEIGQNGFDVSRSENLSRATLIRILNALTDYSSEGGTHTITFGTANQDKVAAEIESIARPKGWTVA